VTKQRKIWPPEKNAKKLNHFAEFLPDFVLKSSCGSAMVADEPIRAIR
jgi:hypothetical protein